VIWLLDVNALLALAHDAHSQHGRVEAWVAALPKSHRLATCSITELAFVRIGPQARLSPDVASAREILRQFSHGHRRKFIRLADDLGADSLPEWVKTPAHTTDGHLVALASARSAKLATLDEGIPGATLIPPS
jgi:predicted nucleic acid-binding protein